MESSSTKHGSLFGAILLVAGCCIGAGMLGLPVLSAKAGFIPSTIIFFACWLYMVTTGILLLEITLWFKQGTHIISMANHTLGRAGKTISWFVFLFLFYTLMVAYIAASGTLVSDFFEKNIHQTLPAAMGSLFFCLLFGLLIYIGTSAIDWFNRCLMLGLIISYIALVSTGLPHVKTELLTYQNWNLATFVLPALIVSFGFHNLVPSLATYLNREPKRVILAILLGSLIPLIIYLMWQILILGLVPLEDFEKPLNQGKIATEALKTAVGSSWILEFAEAFSFFAITTSLLSVSLSFVDFLADALSIKKTTNGKILLSFLVLAPPLVFALVYPNIFITAINYAGGFGAVILFGILPALMAWKGRYVTNRGGLQLIPGGKFFLLLIIVVAISVMGIQFYNQMIG